MKQIESRLAKVEKDYRETGAGLFVSGIFCALWAQYTRRSSWLWFFFGLILAPLALIVLVWKNANDLSDGKMRYWTRDTTIS
jgi:FtsH-binding integral membrane protein